MLYRASYTFSKAIDNTNSEVFATVLSVLDPDCPLKSDDLGFECEVRDGDTIVSRGRYSWNSDYWMAGLAMGNRRPEYIDMMRPVSLRHHMMELPPEVVERLTVHIRGSEALSAANVRSKSFWNGEVVVPLKDLVVITY